MSDDRPTRDSMSIEEATISNMWKIAATVEVLERLGRIIERAAGGEANQPLNARTPRIFCTNTSSLQSIFTDECEFTLVKISTVTA